MRNKKKIGCVIAYSDNHNNYGTSLQGFATIKKIRDLGYDCEIIRYKKQLTLFEKIKLIYLMFRCGGTMDKIRIVKERLNMKLHPMYKKNIQERTDAVNEYKLKRLIPLFHEYVGYEKLCQGSLNYDVVLVGSDQVWTPLSLYSKYYNLLFVSDWVPKVAYASSFGVSIIPSFQHEETKRFLNRFNKIGVRDIRGKEIVETISDNQATVVADPTMLLTREEWQQEIAESDIQEKEPYIFCYFLGTNQEAREAVNNLRDQTGYKVVAIRHMDEFVPSDDVFGDEAPYNVSPNDFIKYISEASYICTDSFHCTVFSIIFQRKFLTFYRFKKHSLTSRNSRIDSLLEYFDLSDRLYNSDICSIKNNIDYNDVNRKLSILREESIIFLKNALELPRNTI